MTVDELGTIEHHARHVAATETRRRLHWYRNGAVTAFLILALGIGYSMHETTAKSYNARGVLCKIIRSGDAQAYQYAKDGLLNHAQLSRALRSSAEYRKLLSPGRGCTTDITPPPRH